MVKYHGKADLRGGGHFSGRLTAPICIAGGLCLQYLNEHYDITIGAHVYQIGDVKDMPFDSVNIAKDTLDEIKAKTLPVIDEEKGALMQKEIERVRDLGDSIGGIKQGDDLRGHDADHRDDVALFYPGAPQGSGSLFDIDNQIGVGELAAVVFQSRVVQVVLAPLADILKGREGRQGLIDEFLVVILEPGLGLGCVNRILRRHQFLIPLCL